MKLHLVILCLLSLTLSAFAQHATEPFIGNLQESWESFPNYQQAGVPYHSGGTPYGLAQATSIFGGAATISSTGWMVIYDQWTAPFGLGTSGTAAVFDDLQGMGLEGLTSFDTPVASIHFSTPIMSFGGYWGAATGATSTDPAVVTLWFFGNSNVLVGTDSFTYSHSIQKDGSLDWHGWNFGTPVVEIRYSNLDVVTDHLQADTYKTLAEQLADLVSLLKSYSLDTGVENSLESKLHTAERALTGIDNTPVCGLLTAFTNEATAQSGKTLKPEDATALSNKATRIMDFIECR